MFRSVEVRRLPRTAASCAGYLWGMLETSGGTFVKLTETKIRNAKPVSGAINLSDDRGLFLLIAPTGSKLWRANIRFEGKRSGSPSGATLMPPCQRFAKHIRRCSLN